jgi:hypothetical protein
LQCVWPGDHSIGAVIRTPIIPDRHGVATLLVTKVIVQYTYDLKYTRFSVQCNWRGHLLYSTGGVAQVSPGGQRLKELKKEERISAIDPGPRARRRGRLAGSVWRLGPSGRGAKRGKLSYVTARRLGLASRALEY